jgi:hypothetical protein
LFPTQRPKAFTASGFLCVAGEIFLTLGHYPNLRYLTSAYLKSVHYAAMQRDQLLLTFEMACNE